jgi:hypothetical protein
MRKIITPAVPEKAIFRCDVTQRKLDMCAATLRISCGYGAPFDGDVFELHLSSEAAEVVIPLLQAAIMGGRSLRHNRTESFFSGPVDRRRMAPEELDGLLKKLADLRAKPKARKSKGRRKAPTAAGVKLLR